MSDQHKVAAAQRGAARTAHLKRRVLRTMRTVRAEMRANGGIYPHNGGAVSMAELARRAEISESSFYKKEPANETLKLRAERWLEKLKKKETVGRTRVRKSLAQRNEEWNTKYHALEQRHIRTELELQSLQAQIEGLRSENAALREQLKASGASKVTSIRKDK
jgi:hypothetical protein